MRLRSVGCCQELHRFVITAAGTNAMDDAGVTNDLIKALIGAAYFDGGMDAAKLVVRSLENGEGLLPVPETVLHSCASLAARSGILQAICGAVNVDSGMNAVERTRKNLILQDQEQEPEV
ncbi:MAG: hypothetical protein Q9209_007381 [Squamulea sp. 1 TL-2023]